MYVIDLFHEPNIADSMLLSFPNKKIKGLLRVALSATLKTTPHFTQ